MEADNPLQSVAFHMSRRSGGVEAIHTQISSPNIKTSAAFLHKTQQGFLSARKEPAFSVTQSINMSSQELRATMDGQRVKIFQRHYIQ